MNSFFWTGLVASTCLALSVSVATGRAFAVTSGVGTATLDKVTPVATVGKPAPDFEVMLADGKKTTLDQMAKEHSLVVLEWYNQDCPYVRKHYDSGNMQALQKTYTGQKVAWLTIVSSAQGKQGYLTLEEAQKRKSSGEKDFASTALLLDPKGTIGKSYGAKTTPHMYIVDKQRVLRYAGAIDGVPTAKKEDVNTDKKYFDSAVSKLLAGKALTTDEAINKPYGCSVKY
jgi:peroxiredoxin